MTETKTRQHASESRRTKRTVFPGVNFRPFRSGTVEGRVLLRLDGQADAGDIQLRGPSPFVMQGPGRCSRYESRAPGSYFSILAGWKLLDTGRTATWDPRAKLAINQRL